MVDVKSVEAQLKRIKFNPNAWGRAEVKELPNILHPEERIYECVNGTYDGGFALLVATDMRVLLIDKKPLNFLTVEDLRFDMINEIDYNHRLMGAKIIISAGNKTLNFRSYNQTRLRKLIGHVQDRMSDIKKEQSEHQENQKQHLAQINQQLQAYLLAQHQQLMQLVQAGQTDKAAPPVPKPSPELADYLFAQSLLQQYDLPQSKQGSPGSAPVPDSKASPAEVTPAQPAVTTTTDGAAANADDLYKAGYKEIFGKATASPPAQSQSTASDGDDSSQSMYQDVPDASTVGKLDLSQLTPKSLEVNPLNIAYSKLPMMLRNRKFGRPGLRAHGQAVAKPAQPAA